MTPTLVKYIKVKDKILVNLGVFSAPNVVEVENYHLINDEYVNFTVIINYLDDFNNFETRDILLRRNDVVVKF
jgi:hypothetical protein